MTPNSSNMNTRRNNQSTGTIRAWLHMVRFSHTLFAMPFALIGFTMAWSDGGENIAWKLFFMILCMVFARSAAMGFNRIVDRKIDALNERTAQREIPTGKISLPAAWTMVITCSALFITSAGMLNPLTLALSPVALATIFIYSYLKRFTWLCHFGIGLSLSLAPVGAYLALMGNFSIYPIALGIGVTLWVAGFDIIYSLQDMEFDRLHHLHSIPARFGLTAAIRIAFVSSLLCTVPIGFSTFHYAPTPFGVGAVGFFFGSVIVQLLSVNRNALSRINGAFMRNNGVASLIFSLLAIAAIVAHTLVAARS